MRYGKQRKKQTDFMVDYWNNYRHNYSLEDFNTVFKSCPSGIII
jgi:hypothetical protein